ADAEHVVTLALHPARAAPHGLERRAAGSPGPELRLHREGKARVEVLHAGHDLEPLLLPVHRGREIEVEAAERLASEPRQLEPALDIHGDRELRPFAVRGHAEALLDLDTRLVERHEPGQSVLGLGAARCPVVLKWEIWSWRRRRPFSSDSGGGGQPGT